MIWTFFWLLARITMFWLAVYGFSLPARFLRERGIMDQEPPWILSGFLAMLILSPLLSLLGGFRRGTMAVLLAAAALAGLIGLFRSISRVRALLGTRVDLSMSFLFGTVALLTMSGLMGSSVPDPNPDALTIYAVAPDRWLDQGSMTYLEESKFSGYPWTGEIISSWPAALSSGRIDQLMLIQVFQMTLLLLTAFTVWRILGDGFSGLLITIGACMASWILVQWASLPKIEMTLVFFSSVTMAMLFRQYLDGDRKFSPVPFLSLGLALATKMTAYVLLPAVLLIALLIPAYRMLSRLPAALLLAAVPPAVFAVNTMLHTGTPFYPNTIPFLPPHEELVLEEVPLIDAHARVDYDPSELLVEREPDYFFTNLGKLIEYWGPPAYLFLAGVMYSVLVRKRYSALGLLACTMIYMVCSALVFDPIRWGAKYALLMVPAMAAAGVRLLKRPLGRKPLRLVITGFLLLMALTGGIMDGFLRLPYIECHRDSGLLPGVGVQPLQEWCNSSLPQGTRLLSLWKRERFFSDHEVLVLQNHPLGRRLLLAEGLNAEMELLDSMGVDYVYFETVDPIPGKLEGSLDFPGSGVLERVTEIQGYTLCRILRKTGNDRRGSRQDAAVDLEVPSDRIAP